ncbi:MAG: mercury methylation corrinoid protein HgcA [Methylocystaceae bacterium]
MGDCCDNNSSVKRIPNGIFDFLETSAVGTGSTESSGTSACCPAPAAAPSACTCSGPESDISTCCSSGVDVPCLNQLTKPHWVVGVINSPIGQVPQAATRWTLADYQGSWKARWGSSRMNYIITPGLYAVGHPDQSSPVFASANYKMSFDHLRRALDNINAWILVLDTKGINVWCAAGKGTFGTAELINQLTRCRMAEVVSNRVIIVPQLGASGIAAHEIKRQSGFRVIYGPVRAKDIPAFISAGYKATRDMRTVRFNTMDRLVLTPIELYNLKTPFMWLAVILLLLQLIGLLQVTWAEIIPILGAVVAGAVAAPILLPLIPGRAFAWKGWLMGLLWSAAVIRLYSLTVGLHGQVTAAAYLLLLPAISAYLTMNFTGSSTYTSLSGVRREMRIAVPLIAGSAGLGIVLWCIRLFV